MLRAPGVRRRQRSQAFRPAAETLERKALMASRLVGSGVDDLALGDVNGDRVVDLVVAGRQGGNFVVAVYDGVGARDAASPTGVSPLVLATLTNPLGSRSGSLSIAVGDFNGDGLSDLAVAAASRTGRGAATVLTYRFQLAPGAQPLGTPVTPVPLGAVSVPRTNSGLALTAGDFNGDGKDELVAGSSSRLVRSLTRWAYDPASGWGVGSRVALRGAARGVGLSAGDLTGDGVTDLAAIDQRSGRVSVLNGTNSAWSSLGQPLGRASAGARVAVVANEQAPGALVVTSGGARHPSAALVSWASRAVHTVSPRTSPGGGALVPVGGGWVYQRSTLHMDGGFAVTNSPNAPTVLFGSTSGQSVVVQGFDAALAPSGPDTHSEPVLSLAVSGATFVSLQEPDNFSETGESGIDVSPLVAFPALAYHSPYAIDLSGLPLSAYEGLWGPATFTAATTDPWGPARVPNRPPTVPSGDSTAWLQGRVPAAYNTYVGLAAYQHHYDASWLPAQGSPWNAVTLGYQTPGIDCTNFTAFAYADALGIVMDSKTTAQAAIKTNADVQIPTEIAGHVNLQVLGPWASYDAMVKDLRPGDILYINPSRDPKRPDAPSDPSKVTHAITWLGNFGKGATAPDHYLIIDSTVDNPPHIDANNRLIPTGVHVRPFNPPDAATNSWYSGHVDHALRIIAG